MGEDDSKQNEDGTVEGSGVPIEDAFDPKWAKRLSSELQTFLQDMIKYAMYVPGAERMCKFLELSALTLTLGRDGGYQGKEGYLTVVKQKRLMDEGPLANAVKKMVRKPISKYFVVRDSFIIVADSHKNVCTMGLSLFFFFFFFSPGVKLVNIRLCSPVTTFFFFSSCID